MRGEMKEIKGVQVEDYMTWTKLDGEAVKAVLSEYYCVRPAICPNIIIMVPLAEVGQHIDKVIQALIMEEQNV